MSVSTQTRTEILQRQSLVMQRWLKGETQDEIADSIGVNRSTVSRDIAAGKSLWRAEIKEEWGDYVNQEWRRLGMLFREAWEAWEKSKGPAEVNTTRTVEKDGTVVTTTTSESRGQCGNPSFLATMIAIIDKRLEITGVKKTPVNITQVNINGAGKVERTDEDRVQKIMEILTRARASGEPVQALPMPPLVNGEIDASQVQGEVNGDGRQPSE